MKVLEHGKHYRETPPVQARCECGCRVEVQEHDLEGGSTPFIWCPECREPVYLPVKEAGKVRAQV